MTPTTVKGVLLGLLLFLAPVAQAGVTPVCPGRVVVDYVIVVQWTPARFLWIAAGVPGTVIGQANPDPAARTVLVRFDYIFAGPALRYVDADPHERSWFDVVVPIDSVRAAPCVRP